MTRPLMVLGIAAGVAGLLLEQPHLSHVTPRDLVYITAGTFQDVDRDHTHQHCLAWVKLDLRSTMHYASTGMLAHVLGALGEQM